MNNWVNHMNQYGHSLIRSVEVKIGGSTIDQHYNDWLDIWDKLTNGDPGIINLSFLQDNFDLEKIIRTFDSSLILVHDNQKDNFQDDQIT